MQASHQAVRAVQRRFAGENPLCPPSCLSRPLASILVWADGAMCPSGVFARRCGYPLRSVSFYLSLSLSASLICVRGRCVVGATGSKPAPWLQSLAQATSVCAIAPISDVRHQSGFGLALHNSALRVSVLVSIDFPLGGVSYFWADTQLRSQGPFICSKGLLLALKSISASRPLLCIVLFLRWVLEVSQCKIEREHTFSS